jgi:hypothetical protein
MPASASEKSTPVAPLMGPAKSGQYRVSRQKQVSGRRIVARSEAGRGICLPCRLSECRILPEQLTAVFGRGMNSRSMHLRTLTSADSRRPPPAGSWSSTSGSCCAAGPPASSGSLGPCARRLSGSSASSSDAAFWSTAPPGSGAPSVAGARWSKDCFEDFRLRLPIVLFNSICLYFPIRFS